MSVGTTYFVKLEREKEISEKKSDMAWYLRNGCRTTAGRK